MVGNVVNRYPLSLSRSRRFCYSGGFALNAALGEAVHVVAVDSSRPAVEAACRNAARNGLQERVSVIKSDALDYMKVCGAVTVGWLAVREGHCFASLPCLRQELFASMARVLAHR